MYCNKLDKIGFKYSYTLKYIKSDGDMEHTNGNTIIPIHNNHPHTAITKGYNNAAIPIAIIHLIRFMIISFQYSNKANCKCCYYYYIT